MPTPATERLHGTLDLMVLKILSVAPLHGWGIAQLIGSSSRDTLVVNQGALYPALHRLLHRGWVRAEWRPSENNRRARYYLLTPAGRRQLGRETEAWHRFAAAMQAILGLTSHELGARP